MDNNEYICYDTETSGLEKRNGQIYQIAAIKLDNNLDEVSRLETDVHPLPYVIPSPSALEVTQVSPDALKYRNNLVTEYEAAKLVHSYFNDDRIQKNRVYVGYNIISFDEEVMRNLYFRNLLEPYISSTKDSRKLDLLQAFRFLHYLRPNTITVPTKDDGKPSFKLGDVANANGYSNENAHNATFDVEMTIKLLKDFKDKAPDVFEKAIETSNKEQTKNFMDANLGKLVWQFTYFGEPSLNPIVPILQSKNKSSYIGVNLNADPSKWLNKSPKKLAEELFTEDSPLVMINPSRPAYYFSKNSAMIRNKIENLDIQKYEEIIEQVMHQSTVKKLSSVIYFSNQGFRDKLDDVELTSEEQIYGGFLKKADKELMEKFHQNYGNRQYITEEILPYIQDPRILDFASRISSIGVPNSELTKYELEALENAIERRLCEDDDPKLLTFKRAKMDLDRVRDPQLKVSYEEMLNSLEKEYKNNLSEIKEALENIILEPQKNEQLSLF